MYLKESLGKDEERKYKLYIERKIQKAQFGGKKYKQENGQSQRGSFVLLNEMKNTQLFFNKKRTQVTNTKESKRTMDMGSIRKRISRRSYGYGKYDKKYNVKLYANLILKEKKNLLKYTSSSKLSKKKVKLNF